MPWILLDVAVPVVALVVLALVALSLWRRIRALSSTVGDAAGRIAGATDALAEAQAGLDVESQRRGNSSAAPPF